MTNQRKGVALESLGKVGYVIGQNVNVVGVDSRGLVSVAVSSAVNGNAPVSMLWVTLT